MKYIDADRLKAEIERLYDIARDASYNGEVEGEMTAYDKILSIIASLQQEQPELPGIEEPGIPGKDFIPVEWVDACEMYGKWKIVKQEQPEVDLDEVIENYILENFGERWDGAVPVGCLELDLMAEHFYKLGKNTRMEE